MTLPPVAYAKPATLEPADTFPAGSAAEAQRLLDALGALLDDRSALAEWLGTFDDERRAANCAARSYWHANGFAKLVLKSASEGCIRLHVWPPGPDRLGEANPHAHRWNFASSVLCGDGIRSTEYVECSPGMPFVRHRYAGGRTGAALIPECSTQLQVSDDPKHFPTGERYAVTTDIVHTIEPLGTSLVATLLVQGPPKLTSTPVYCAPGQQADQHGTPISAADVRQLVRDVLDALHGLGMR